MRCTAELKQLLRASAPDLVDDVAIVVSELVTNAVQAGARDVAVKLDAHHSFVRIAVQDEAGGAPVPQAGTSTDEHGRGLSIVAHLTSGWTATPTPHGKEISAELSVVPTLTGEVFHCDLGPA